MRPRAIVPLMASAFAAGAVALGGPASAAAAPPRAVAAIARDCAAHRGALTVTRSRGVVRRAARIYARQGLSRSPCGIAVASQDAVRRRVTRRDEAKRVVADCLADNGRLIRRYSARTLRRAFRGLDFHLARGTDCPVGIASQYNAQRRRGAAALVPGAQQPTPKTPDPLPIPQSVARQGASLTAFGRPRTAADAAPPWVRVGPPDAVGADASQSRALGDRGDLALLPTPSGSCLEFRASASRTVVQCGIFGVHPAREFVASVAETSRGWVVYGRAIRGMRDVRLLPTGRRTAIPIEPVGDAYEATAGSRVPRLLTYVDDEGTQRYQMFSSAFPDVPR